MPRTKPWEISDAFWALIEPLVPTSLRSNGKEYRRKPGGGRKQKYSNRLYFSAIVYVLRTGIQWNALPRHYSHETEVHRKMQPRFLPPFRSGAFSYGLLSRDYSA